GKIRPIIDRTFQFSAVKQAHEYMEANKNIGKIILKITE
ncbi:zinc-binding dehydrogenase, partial [Enterococcus casseliflavus]